MPQRCVPPKGKPGFGRLFIAAAKCLLPTFKNKFFMKNKVPQAFPTTACSRQNPFTLLCSVPGEKLVPGAREVLTEIFKSCVHSEQMLSLTPAKPIKVADIYLSKEQINSQTPGNLLHLFFTNVRPPKKVLEDQLTQVAAAAPMPGLGPRHASGGPENPVPSACPQILRKYGVPKPKFDKSKYSRAGKEQHPVKVVSTKRPITKPPAKDKAVLNSVRWVCAALGGGQARAPGSPAILALLCLAAGPFQSLARQLREFRFIHESDGVCTVRDGKQPSLN